MAMVQTEPCRNRRAPLGKRAEIRGSGLWRCFMPASFGIELTVDNFAALYYTDTFHLSLQMAGLVASLFGMMNLFARALGGIVSDRCNRRWGLRGRPCFWLHVGGGGAGNDAVFPDACAAARRSRQHDVHRSVREDVERGQLFGGAFRQQTSAGRGSRNRRRGG